MTLGEASPHAHYWSDLSKLDAKRSSTYLGMYGSSRGRPFPLLLAEITLCRWSSLFLDLKQWPVGMCTSRHSMSFDACRTSKLLVVDQHHRGCVRVRDIEFLAAIEVQVPAGEKRSRRRGMRIKGCPKGGCGEDRPLISIGGIRQVSLMIRRNIHPVLSSRVESKSVNRYQNGKDRCTLVRWYRLDPRVSVSVLY
jgi:hypothetical protein